MEKFINIFIFLVLWVCVSTTVYFLVGPMWVLVPAFGGLGLFFYINRDRPAGPPPTALLLLAAALSAMASSCARRPAAQLPARALAIPPAADSLAQLPPWLVPPPAGSTPAQAKQWQKAQQKALANATRPAGKVKVKNAGNSRYTLKQREKLNRYDRSKQQSKQKNDQRDQTQQKADLRHKEKPVTKTGLQLPAGFWIALALGLVGLIVWLVVRFTARSALR